ncbi:DUF1330 domain-containing protein [Roseovarius faecimaris]|nr:DUF1330 domain-containing protein [Roseovarius faecimaris]
MSTVMLSQITVKDPEKFQDYLGKSKSVAGRYGAELLYAGQVQDVLHGTPVAHRMIVMVRFPDRAALRGWFDDPEYKAIVPLREAASDQVLVAYSDAS